MIFLITKNKTKLNLLYKCSSIYKIIPLSTQRKGWSSKRRRVLCWSIYIISLCCIVYSVLCTLDNVQCTLWVCSIQLRRSNRLRACDNIVTEVCSRSCDTLSCDTLMWHFIMWHFILWHFILWHFILWHFILWHFILWHFILWHFILWHFILSNVILKLEGIQKYTLQLSKLRVKIKYMIL